jgi:hypothetical protein
VQVEHVAFVEGHVHLLPDLDLDGNAPAYRFAVDADCLGNDPLFSSRRIVDGRCFFLRIYNIAPLLFYRVMSNFNCNNFEADLLADF